MAIKPCRGPVCAFAAAILALCGSPALGQTAGSTAKIDGADTAILLKAIGAMTALRATQEEEMEGLDISLHGEAIQ